MCFSPQASFVMGAALTVVGALTIKETVKKPKLLILALVPLFFGIQQLAEGVVWLHMNGVLHETPISKAAKCTYLFFSWVCWPTLIPLGIFIPEKVPWRKWTSFVALITGVIISYVNLSFLLTQEVLTSVLGRSIYYGGTEIMNNAWYAAVILVPLFASSIPNMWIFGLVVLIAFVFSQIIYAITFTSVWCFFAAMMSILLYFILKNAAQPEVE